ncbi:helix-turn-helix transcriptional regulator [Arabiibacter massiliensis]|uniref:helix-turn-helix transcriptional regulator n=1 Tax=Arabiibacter massiliensis TaxID=1870985 RepID=UPI00155ADADD|nr:LuxR C-terminal-related transcriptional regulator [Arabiibacter massiliensis]
MWIAWVTLIYSTDILAPDAGDANRATSLAFVLSTLALSACLMVASAAPVWVQSHLLGKAQAAVASCVGALSTLAVLRADVVPGPVFCIAALLTGFATALVALRAAELFSEIDAKNMLVGMCASLILGILVYSFAIMMLMCGLKGASVLTAVLLLPLSACFLFMGEAGSEEGEVAVEPLRCPRSFWRLIAYVVVLVFLLSITRGYYPNLIDAGEFATSRSVVAMGLILAAAAIAALVAAMPRDASFGTLCYALFSASVAAVLLLSLLNVDATTMGNVSSVLFGITLVCLWGLLCCASFRSGASAVRVVGMGFGAACVGTAAGFATGALLHEAGSGALLSVTVASLVACVLAALFLLRREDIYALMRPYPENGEGFDAEPPEAMPSRSEAPGIVNNAEAPALDDYRLSLQRLCARVALEYGLSPREADVLPLLASGKDARAMADELFVSFNTVRTHIKKIYMKLDVHSRHELMELVEREMERAKQR